MTCQCRVFVEEPRGPGNPCGIFATSFPTTHADGGAGLPYGSSGYPMEIGDVLICTYDRTDEVCYPGVFNPELRFADGGLVDAAGVHPPSELELEQFCEGPVAALVTQAVRAHWDPSSCHPLAVCTAQPRADDPTRTRTRNNANCNTICGDVPLDVNASTVSNNLFKATTLPTTSSLCAAPGPVISPLCRATAYDPPGVPSDALLIGGFGPVSRATVVSSSATITIGTSSPATTTVQGSVEVHGTPCSAGGCNVGLRIDLDVADFTAGGFQFEGLEVSGSGVPPGATVNSSHQASFATGTYFTTIRGTVKDATSHYGAFETPNYGPVDLTVNWETGVVTIAIDQTIPGTTTFPETRIQLTLTASIINRPPHAVSAGSNQVLECSSHGGQNISLGASASDLDNNVQWFVWERDPGPTRTYVGRGQYLTTTQGLGSHTYRVRAIDADTRSITATTSVNIIDTVPPSPGTPSLDWGCGGSQPRDVLQRLCGIGSANGGPVPATDVCDPSPAVVPTLVTAYDAAGNVLQSFQCGGSLPLGTSDPSAIYEVVWTAVDSSFNSSAEWLTRVGVKAVYPASDCSGATPIHYAGRVLYNGPRASAPSLTADARVALDFSLAGPGAYSLPSGFGLQRASAATVQSGAGSVVTTGIGTDTARVGDDGNGHFGLVFEEARTNILTQSRNLAGSGWYGGYNVTTTTGAANGPDGASGTAGRSNVSTYGYSNFQALGALSGNYIASQWLASPGTSSNYQLFNELDPWTGAVATGVVGSAWRRASVRYAFPSGSYYSYFVPADARDHTALGGLTAQNINTLSDLHQLEAGGFPTEAIVTTSSSATRAGERLYATSAGTIVDAGRVLLELRIQPKGARSEYTGWTDLWSNGSNYASIYAPTGTLYVSIGGASNSASGIDWARGDTIDLFVAAGGGASSEIAWRINDRQVTQATVSGSALGSLGTSGALDLLCTGTSFEFSAWVQQIKAWHTGMRPQWLW